MGSKHGYQITHTSVDVSGAGDTTIVSALSGRKIVVVSLFLVSAGSMVIKFQSSTTTDLQGDIHLTAQNILTLPMNEYGWFKTAEGELLNLNLTDGAAGTLQLSGTLGYFCE